MITGSLVALVTPMLEDGSIDFDAYRALIDWHVEQGTDAIVAVGTSGESPTVSVDEHCELMKVAVEHAAGRIPVIAGAGGNSTHEAIKLTRYAHSVGANATLQVVPYYNKPTAEGQYQHFKAIAEAVPGLPILLYNVPGRTGIDMSVETTVRLAQVPGIIGIKEASGNIEKAQWLIREVPAEFGVFSGDDGTAIALMLLGGRGNVSVTANLAPRLMHQLCQAALAGDTATARRIQMRLLPLHKLLFVEPNPIPLKWAMARLGLCTGTMRLPLTEHSAQYTAALEQALHEAGLLH